MLSKLIELIRLPHREDKLFGWVSLMLFLTPLFFLPMLFDAFDFPRLALLAILLGFSLFVFINRSNLQLQVDRVLKFSLIAFLILNIVSWLNSSAILNSFIGYERRHANSLLFVIVWSLLILLVCFVNSKDKVLTLFRLFVISGLLVAVLGILHSFGIGYYVGPNPEIRTITPGFIGNQNFSAMYLVGIIPFLLPLLVKAKGSLSKILYGTSAFVMLWALMVFASRGSIIAMFGMGILGIAGLFLRKFSWSIRLGVMSILLVSAVLAGFFYSSTRISGLDTSLDVNTDSSTQQRLEVWVQSTEIIKQHPWVGVGQGNFLSAFNKLGDATLIGDQRFDDAHNLFIDIAVATGIPSLVAFLLLMAVALWTSAKNFWYNRSLVSWAIFVGLGSVLVSAIFNPVAISVWILLAFSVAASQFSVTPEPVQEKPKYLKVVIVVFGCLLILAGISLIASEFVSKLGLDSYRAQQYENSIKYGNYSLLLNPFKPYPNLYITASMIKLNQDPVSVRQKISSLGLNYQNTVSTLQSGAALSFMLHENTKDQQDLETMFRYLEALQNAEPNYGPNLINAAYYSFRAKNYDLATKYLNHALALDKQHKYSYAYLLLAQIQLEQGRLDSMYESLQNANKISPHPGFKIIFDDYKAGNFKAKSLPIEYPPIDI